MAINNTFYNNDMHSTKQNKIEQDEVIICHKNWIEST